MAKKFNGHKIGLSFPNHPDTESALEYLKGISNKSAYILDLILTDMYERGLRDEIRTSYSYESNVYKNGMKPKVRKSRSERVQPVEELLFKKEEKEEEVEPVKEVKSNPLADMLLNEVLDDEETE